MNKKLNNILQKFDSLSLKDQEALLEIEKQKLVEKKRKQLLTDVKEAEQEFKSGGLKPESVDDIMRGIDETSKNNKIFKTSKKVNKL